jgi:hypothetical protein
MRNAICARLCQEPRGRHAEHLPGRMGVDQRRDSRPLCQALGQGGEHFLAEAVEDLAGACAHERAPGILIGILIGVAVVLT